MTKPAPVRYPDFARRVKAAMDEREMSNSDLARAIWGTTTDYRGYPVARNRDRIGHYLAGVSYPDAKNLQKLAAVLGIAIDDLPKAKQQPARGLTNMTDTHIVFLNDHPGVCSLQVRKLVSADTGLQIIALLAKDRLPDGV